MSALEELQLVRERWGWASSSPQTCWRNQDDNRSKRVRQLFQCSSDESCPTSHLAGGGGQMKEPPEVPGGGGDNTGVSCLGLCINENKTSECHPKDGTVGICEIESCHCHNRLQQQKQQQTQSHHHHHPDHRCCYLVKNQEATSLLNSHKNHQQSHQFASTTLRTPWVQYHTLWTTRGGGAVQRTSAWKLSSMSSSKLSSKASLYACSSPNWVLLLVVWVSLITYVCASSTSPAEPPGRQEKVCKDIDIRNRVNFSKLENCTVIEGSLQILLIDYADPSEYENLFFPKLLEITDYLLLYRVYGLSTLAHIFPNLAVIRGQKLFFNYALVAFEMPDLEELGLVGLTHILRGAVRLEKNAKLCYVHTIDWSRIARNVSAEDHFISQNKDINECADKCPDSLPCERLAVPNGDGVNRTRAVCWNGDKCQKVCPPKCESGCFVNPETKKEECCNEHCVGGCVGPGANQCFACKDVLGITGRCQQRCTGTFKFMNRRCILKRDCLNLKTRGHPWKYVQWKLHKNECIKECPSGYMDMDNNNKCTKCPGPCPKICLAKVVDSVATAQELKGCTVIEGILEIQIRGGSQVGHELESNLGLIEKVTEYVKVARSYGIASLHFLKSLKVIQGSRQFNDRYSLVVLDNQNLQEIWDLRTHPKLTLMQGFLFFHRNHKLCHYKIKEFVQSIGLKMELHDISTSTNGDQMPCNISQINISVTQVTVNFAVVKWTAFEMNDNRQLLSYVIYYKESPYKNQTIFNTRDSCGQEDWQTYDVRPVPGHNLAELVYDLKPWTQYAMYIQTYMLSSTSEGGVSPIIYFTTLPTTPTHPRDVQVKAISPYELKVTWLPPNKPNGNVTHYKLYWQPQPLNREKLDKRDYCKDKLHLGWKNRKSKVEDKVEEERNQTQSDECCKCPKTEEEKKQEEEERRMEIEFQNFLQDTVYVKRPSKQDMAEPTPEPHSGSQVQVRRRRRRALSGSKVQDLMKHLGFNESYWPEGLNISSLSNMSMVNETEGPAEDHVTYVAAVVYGKTEMILPNLKHFQEYSIEVIACHDPQVNDKTEKQCSNRAITTGRTLPEPTKDTISIQNVSSVVEVNGRVRIRWADPTEPNGLIVTYEIEYGKVSQENYKFDVLCIPHVEYRKTYGYILGTSKRLQPGNYSYRIRATSLAGNGTWTMKLYFLLPDRYNNPSVRNTLVIVVPVIVGVILVIMIMAAALYFVYKKRLAQNLPAGVLYASVNPHYLSPDDVYVPDEWEVPRDKIKLLRELGQGSFGMVHEGIATNLIKNEPVTRVAVKTVNENATIRDRIEFLQEASVMKAFNCNHVVKLLGVVSKGQPTMVIMELMAAGDLKNFLRIHRPTEEDNNGRKPPTLKQILQMAGEIADGMAYLSATKFVHRDLAARNCMVSEDHIVKVGDFGMTRDIYETDYYRKGGKGLLPVRWMAPESLKDGIFTSQSDVWSYGVVLWEMATLAFQPYQGLANEQVLKYVIDGGVMQQPYGCPDRLYKLMLLCWRHNAKHRPTFIEIVESLHADLNEYFHKKSYFYSEERKEKEREQEEKERENAEKERENAEIELAEAAAMAAAKANAIGPEDFEPYNDEDEDITTPLTGSPRYSSQDLDDLDADSHRQSMDSLCSQCSHRRPCECIDIDNAKNKPGPSNSGSPLRRLYMDALNTHGSPSNSGDHRAGVGYHPPPPHAPNYSSEGSKESSKSSGSSHLHLNGISNGHLPKAYLAQHKYAEC